MDASSSFRTHDLNCRQPRLSCPRDGTQLIEERKGEIRFLSCPRCQGWWLPSIAAQALVGRVPTSIKAASPKIQCPNDQLLLSVVKCRNVEVDLCESCGGVWLDAGEWQKIARRKAKGNTFGTVADVGGEFAVEAGCEIVGFVVRCIFEALSGF